MANILTIPESGIFFDGNTAGAGVAPVLTGNASGVAIQYDGYAGVEINSSATGVNYLDRFSVEGTNGRLFGVTDEVVGTVFSVNDAAGLPIIEVESTANHDKITIGEYGTNALVVSGSSVQITGSTAATQAWVSSQNYISSQTDDQTLDEVLAQGSTSTRSMSVGDLTARVGSFKSIDASASTLMNLLCNDGNNAATFRTTVSGRVFEIRSQNSGTLKFDSTSSTFTGNVTVNGNTVLGNALTDKAIVHGHLGIGHDDYPKIAYPGQNALWSGSGSTTGQIVIDLPGTLANYDMMYMEIDIYEYSTKGATKLIIGGHNWNGGGNSNTSTTQWHNVNVQVLGALDKPVYFGRRNDGSNERRCIAIGETNSTWSYATVQVHKVHGAEFYASQIDWVGDWNIAQTTSGSYFTKNPTTNFNSGTTLETNGNISASGATLTSLPTYSGSQTTALMIAGANVVGQRALGTNAFNSTSFLSPAGGTMNSGAAITFTVPSSGGNFININHTGNEAWTIGAQSGSGVDDYLDIGISGGTRAMSWHETGRVGIGTTTPNVPLEVHGADITSSSNTTAVSVLRLVRDITDSSHTLRKDSAVDFMLSRQEEVANNLPYTRLDIRLAGTTDSSTPSLDVMSLFHDGYVGIGTTSPDYRLHVSGTVGLTSSLYFTNNTAYIQIGSSWGNGVLNFLNGATTAIQFDVPNNRIRNNLGKYLTDSSTTGQFGTLDDESVAIVANNSTKMTILSGGNVGIGITSPSYPLEVANAASVSIAYQRTGVSAKKWGFHSANANTYWQNLTDNLLALTVSNAGNVGIGTTNPSTILDVSGTGVGAAGINLSQGEASTISNRLFFSNGTANQGISMYNLSGKLVFGTGATAGSSSGDPRMYLTNTGNLGIGTASPSSMLHLEDAVSPTLQIKDTTNNVTFKAYAQDSNSHLGNTSNHDLFIDTNNVSRITVKADGKVGINTGGTTLHNSFTVQGNANISNGDGAYLTFNNGDANITAHYNSSGTNGRDLSFKTWKSGVGNTEKMRIDKDGNVGIGTTAPSVGLQLGNSVSGQTKTAIFNSEGGSEVGLTIQSRTNRAKLRVADNDSNAYVVAEAGKAFFGASSNGDTNNITVLTDGNVGIGTTSPDAKLVSAGIVDGDFTALRLMNQKTYGSGTGTNEKVRFVMGISESGTPFSSREGFAIDVGVIDQSDSSNTIVNFGVRDGGVLGTYQTVNGHDKSVDFVGSVTVGGVIQCSGSGTSNFTGGVNVSGDLNINSGSAIHGTIKSSSNSLTLNARNTGIMLFQSGGSEKMRIASSGNVGIEEPSPAYKLDVNGGIRAGGKITYHKSAGSLTTTGYAVAGLLSFPNGNGASAGFTFTCFGHTGKYQKIVYSCYNATGTWNTQKVIDEGTNDFDVVASANGSTITFTFKSRAGTKSYTPRVSVEAFGSSINTTYA